MLLTLLEHRWDAFVARYGIYLLIPAQYEHVIVVPKMTHKNSKLIKQMNAKVGNKKTF